MGLLEGYPEMTASLARMTAKRDGWQRQDDDGDAALAAIVAQMETLLAASGPAGSPATLPGAGMFPGLAVRSVTAAVVTGDNEVFTVPAGRRAMVVKIYGRNAGGVSTNVRLGVKLTGGTTYGYSFTTASASITAPLNVASNMALVMEAGEKLVVRLSASSGTVAVKILEWDATGGPKTARIYDPASGDSLLYTAPAGQNALLLSGSFAVDVLAGNPVLHTGWAATIPTAWYAMFLPAGQTLGAEHRITNNQAGLANSVSSINWGIHEIGPADKLYVNLDATCAGALVWQNLMEYTP